MYLIFGLCNFIVKRIWTLYGICAIQIIVIIIIIIIIKSGPFYLNVIDKPVSNIWYKKTSMGKNLTNQKTVVKKLKSPGTSTVVLFLQEAL